MFIIITAINSFETQVRNDEKLLLAEIFNLAWHPADILVGVCWRNSPITHNALLRLGFWTVQIVAGCDNENECIAQAFKNIQFSIF